MDLSLPDKRLFEISVVEITRADCSAICTSLFSPRSISITHQWINTKTYKITCQHYDDNRMIARLQTKRQSKTKAIVEPW